MAVNGVELAVGQRWKTRSGEVVHLTEDIPSLRHRWTGCTEGEMTTHTWTDEGVHFAGQVSPLDLVELVVDQNLIDHVVAIRAAVLSAEELAEAMKPGKIFELPPNLRADELAKEHAKAMRALSALDIQVGGGHYKKMAIQPVEYIHKNGIGFCEGSAIKYLTRWRDKGGIEDLKKAKHFIDLLIEMEEQAAQ